MAMVLQTVGLYYEKFWNQQVKTIGLFIMKQDLNIVFKDLELVNLMLKITISINVEPL